MKCFVLNLEGCNDKCISVAWKKHSNANRSYNFAFLGMFVLLMHIYFTKCIDALLSLTANTYYYYKTLAQMLKNSILNQYEFLNQQMYLCRLAGALWSKLNYTLNFWLCLLNGEYIFKFLFVSIEYNFIFFVISLSNL